MSPHSALALHLSHDCGAELRHQLPQAQPTHAYSVLAPVLSRQCVKLKSRLEAYGKQLKPKRADELSEMERLQLHRQHEQCNKALQTALLNWDRASKAAAWLQRDFELVYGSSIAHSVLRNLTRAREEIKAKLGQLAQTSTTKRVFAHSLIHL